MSLFSPNVSRIGGIFAFSFYLSQQCFYLTCLSCLVSLAPTTSCLVLGIFFLCFLAWGWALVRASLFCCRVVAKGWSNLGGKIQVNNRWQQPLMVSAHPTRSGKWEYSGFPEWSSVAWWGFISMPSPLAIQRPRHCWPLGKQWRSGSSPTPQALWRFGFSSPLALCPWWIHVSDFHPVPQTLCP